jgi:hypothetical protein
MSVITVYCEVTAYIYIVRLQCEIGSLLTALLLNTQGFWDVTQAFPNIQGQTVLNCLILKIKTLHFFKMSKLSCPLTQCPRIISPNDTVSHCPRTPESLDTNFLEKTAVPIFKQQTPVYKTV